MSHVRHDEVIDFLKTNADRLCRSCWGKKVVMAYHPDTGTATTVECPECLGSGWFAAPVARDSDRQAALVEMATRLVEGGLGSLLCWIEATTTNTRGFRIGVDASILDIGHLVGNAPFAIGTASPTPRDARTARDIVKQHQDIVQ